MIVGPTFDQDLAPHSEFLRSRIGEAGFADDVAALASRLPDVRPGWIELDAPAVSAGHAQELSPVEHDLLLESLRALKPWRKGPFQLFDIRIDSEWNSALKWERAASQIAPLQDRKVLDIGCSNGYYMFRMAAQSPRVVLGIEPYRTYYSQFYLLQHYFHTPRVHCLPVALEALRGGLSDWFDTVFCMGIVYHRRSPLDMLGEIRDLMAPDGELVLETLVAPGEEETALFPAQRYAGMRNVYFIPTVPCLHNWLRRSGFDRIRCVDITRTEAREQRKTPWIDSETLCDFLDPADARRTIEGYPAPVRALVLANKRRC